MRWPLMLRSRHDDAMTRILADIAALNKAKRDLEARIRDIERQFVTKYADDGRVIETLADVAIDDRAAVKVVRRPKHPLQGMSWPQRRAALEATDGLRDRQKD